MQYPVTLLAPARDLSVGKAAIQAGADAVYIGAPQFGARQAAGNSVADIAALVRYAHPFGVQVLVTLNTLLTDDELPQAIAMAHQLHEVGVDAFIIQDMRLAAALGCPSTGKPTEGAFRLHASTQCDNRTPEQVQRLQEMGFKRVVLARELSIEEIRTIAQAVHSPSTGGAGRGLELEAFIHGALCVSYSGRCYLSEVLLNRSANRGCCAQMCRMQYDLLDANGQEIVDDDGQPIHQRYLLSLQDLDRSMYIRELMDAGVTTFKIEGRLKDADYVTNIVAYYRHKLDEMGIVTASKASVYRYDFTPNPEKTFHRGGTDYFLHGRTPNMTNWDTPKSTGEHIGELISTQPLIVRLNEGVTLANGDGLCVGDQGFNVNGVQPMGNHTYRLQANHPLASSPSRPLAHLPLYRNLDTAFQRSLHAERRIPVDITFETVEEGFRLTIGDRSQVFAYPHEPAKDPERAYQTIYQQLTKLGDTIYAPKKVTTNLSPITGGVGGGLFIPISKLNEWRRQLTQNL